MQKKLDFGPANQTAIPVVSPIHLSNVTDNELDFQESFNSNSQNEQFNVLEIPDNQSMMDVQDWLDNMLDKSPPSDQIGYGDQCYHCRKCSDQALTFNNRGELFRHQREQHRRGLELAPLPWVRLGQSAPWINDEGGINPGEEGFELEYRNNEATILELNNFDSFEGEVFAYFNFPTHDLQGDTNEVGKYLEQVFLLEKHSLHYAISLGFIYHDIETDKFTYFVPYSVMKEGKIYSRSGLEKATFNLGQHDLAETLRNARPNTKSKCRYITNVVIRVSRMEFPLGGNCQLPSWLKKLKCVWCLDNSSKNGSPYNDNLCFFRNLAAMQLKKKRNIEKLTEELFDQWCKYSSNSGEKFPGVGKQEFTYLEECFDIQINVFERQLDGSVRPYFFSSRKTGQRLDMNIFQTHLSLIVDFAQYAKKYKCPRCERHFKHISDLKVHLKGNCSNMTSFCYPGGLFHHKKDLFEELADYGIVTESDDKFSNYHIQYDFESILITVNEAVSEKLTWTHKHQPISVGLCSNIPGYEEPVCIVNENMEELLMSMKAYLGEMQQVAKILELKRLESVLDAIDVKIKWFQAQEDELIGDKSDTIELEIGVDQYETEYFTLDECEPVTESDTGDQVVTLAGKLRSHLETLKSKLLAKCSQIPVMGINTSRYDANLIKSFLTWLLSSNDDPESENVTVIKKGNDYMCLATREFKFLDIGNYLAQGTSLSVFLKSFQIAEKKSYFCYEYLDSFDKLKERQLLPYEAFYSSLKGVNTLEAEYKQWEKNGGDSAKRPKSGPEIYAELQQIWISRGMTTLKDFLVYYMEFDTKPMSMVVEKMRLLYKNMGVDKFCSSAISLPGIARALCFKEARQRGVQFSLFYPQDEDLYLTVKQGLVGGPSIIQRRYHSKNLTYIRENIEKPCQNICGYDASAMYLWGMSRAMPTGLYVRRLSEDLFKPRLPMKYLKQFEWMDLEASFREVTIQHLLNTGEEVGMPPYFVDGFDAENQEIYEVCFVEHFKIFVSNMVSNIVSVNHLVQSVFRMRIPQT